MLHVEAAKLRDLRCQFRHNLTRLLDESLQHDLCGQCPELTDTHIEVIRRSSPVYAGKQYEYIWVGFGSQPPIDLVAEAAETLIAGLSKLQMRPAQPQDRREKDPNNSSFQSNGQRRKPCQPRERGGKVRLPGTGGKVQPGRGRIKTLRT